MFKITVSFAARLPYTFNHSLFFIMFSRYKAFIFDLNGTMIDDMAYHVQAWHGLLQNLGADITLEQTKEQCYGKNAELLERVFPHRFTTEEKYDIGLKKEKTYQREFKPHLKLLPGLSEFLKDAEKAGIRMAIGSAAIMQNIDFVIDGLDIRHYFSAIVSADDVMESKPHPETFLKCAEQLGISPADCLVFEDAPKGIEAAVNAGMDSVILTTMHSAEELSGFKNAVAIGSDYRNLISINS